MKEYLKCKACSYIISKDNTTEVCPACGFPRKVFEEYKYNISSGRKFILDVDFHAIMVHLPQTIAVLIPFFGFTSLVTDAGIGIKLLYTVEVMAYILPLTVASALISGMFDGKTRFRKLNTPALKKKIILSSILFTVTAIMMYLTYSMDIKDALFPLMGLSIISLGIQAILARTGIKLMFAWLPG